MTTSPAPTPELRLLVDNVDFGEGPRWHDGRLWYSDFYQRAIYSVTTAGERTVMFGDLDDRPSGLGWMPDGSLLAVAMTSRSVWREVDGTLQPHADLSAIATGHCNDMVVDAAGNAYVGNFGFDFEGGATFAAADLALVRADGSVEVAAEGLAFPNGSVITPDGSTLIVGESFGGDYVAFDIADDATLSNRRVWAAIPGAAPDGCAQDADGGIWFSDAFGSQVVRVAGRWRGHAPRRHTDVDLRVRAGRGRPADPVRPVRAGDASRRTRGQGARRDLHSGPGSARLRSSRSTRPISSRSSRPTSSRSATTKTGAASSSRPTQ